MARELRKPSTASHKRTPPSAHGRVASPKLASHSGRFPHCQPLNGWHISARLPHVSFVTRLASELCGGGSASAAAPAPVLFSPLRSTWPVASGPPLRTCGGSAAADAGGTAAQPPCPDGKADREGASGHFELTPSGRDPLPASAVSVIGGSRIPPASRRTARVQARST